MAPAVGLVDEQEVRLEGAGWPPEAGLRVATCQVGAIECDVDEVEVVADEVGELSVDLTVDARFVSGQGDPVDCRAVACELRVVRDDGPVGARLTFDPEARLRPQPTLTVRPAAGLRDGERVDVRAEHLDPGSHVGFALCAAGARSVFDDRCYPYDAGLLEEERAGEGRPVGAAGVVVAELVVYVDAYAYDDRVDCRAERCELVVTQGGAVITRAPVAVEPGAVLLGPARLTATPSSPSTGLAIGDRVELRGSGFYAGEPVLVEQCAADSAAESCIGGPSERWIADDEGRFDGTFTLQRHVSTDFQEVDCLVVDCVLRADRYAFVPPLVRQVPPIRLDR